MVRRAASSTVRYRDADSESEEEDYVQYNKKKKMKPAAPTYDDNDSSDIQEVDPDESDEDYGRAKKKKKSPVKQQRKPKPSPKKKKSPSKRVRYDEDYDSEFEEQPPRKKVKRKPAAPPARKPGPKSKVSHRGPRGKISPSKTPASKRQYLAACRASSSGRKYKSSYADDSEEEDEEEEEEEEEEEFEEEVESDDYYYEEPVHRGRGRPPGKSPKHSSRYAPPPSPKPKNNFPPISEMVVDCIKALKDNPKKGSTLGSIKETIALNWPVNMKIYDSKIKKWVLKAIDSGELVLVKGKGVRGRYTVPGFKVKRKKKKKKSATKDDQKYDEDEVEYVAPKTKRDETRERTAEEIEKHRLEVAAIAEKKAMQKALKPKRAPAPRKEEWEVESVLQMKEVNGEKFYKVKFIGYAKPQWEPEENVEDCTDLIEAYFEEKRKKEEYEELRRQEEADGHYEVSKVVDVRFHKNGSRDFLIRWKHHTAADDSWEPEDNLDCQEIIQAFMDKLEKLKHIEGHSLREVRKPVKRLAFGTHSSRVGKRMGGFRVTYEDMDE